MKRKEPPADAVEFDYGSDLRNKARAIGKTLRAPPWPLLKKAMQIRAAYILSVKDFMRERADHRTCEFVYVPVFQQLNRSMEGVGRAIADAYGQGTSGNAVSSHRTAYGSLLESLFFLECLPPPFSTTLCDDLGEFRRDYALFIEGEVGARRDRFMGGKKDDRRHSHAYDEVLARIRHDPPAVFAHAREFSQRIINEAILFLERRCEPDDLEIDGGLVRSLVEQTTCMPANVIEGFGRLGMGMNLTFLYNARAGIWKCMGTCALLPPPFSTVFSDEAMALSAELDEYVDASVASVLENLIRPPK